MRDLTGTPNCGHNAIAIDARSGLCSAGVPACDVGDEVRSHRPRDAGATISVARLNRLRSPVLSARRILAGSG